MIPMNPQPSWCMGGCTTASSGHELLQHRTTAWEVNMKRTLVYIATGALLLGYIVAAYGIHEIIPSETVVAEPGPNADKLNDYLVRYNPYRSWSLFPGKGRLYRAEKPLGLVTTFVNNTAYRSISGQGGMADGSMIVTENYSDDKKFLALFVMYKIKGYNPDGGDWFWAQYAPSGTVKVSGNVKACIECHAARKDNDYIFTGTVKK